MERELDDERVVGFLRQPFLASSWHDILPMMPINAAIARLLGKPLEVLGREQGTQQARHDAERVYRRLFDAMTLDNMAERMTRFERQYYDFGDSQAETPEPGHILLRRLGVPDFISRWYAPMHAAYAEQILLRLKGATFVESTVDAPTDAGKREGFLVVDIDHAPALELTARPAGPAQRANAIGGSGRNTASARSTGEHAPSKAWTG